MSLHSAFLANGKVQRESTPPRRLYASPFRSPAPRPLLKSLPTEVASATDLGAPVGISIARSIDRSADSFTLSSQRVAQSLARSDRTRSEGKAFTAREITSDRRPHGSRFFPSLFSVGDGGTNGGIRGRAFLLASDLLLRFFRPPFSLCPPKFENDR